MIGDKMKAFQLTRGAELFETEVLDVAFESPEVAGVPSAPGI